VKVDKYSLICNIYLDAPEHAKAASHLAPCRSGKQPGKDKKS